ncbi:MAG: hypothetical protein ACJ786_39580 [Catenulispora sp.]
MTGPVTVPDEGPITFKLWFPRWEPVTGGSRCSFEVTSAGLEQLADGSAGCMRQLLADLAQPASSPDLEIQRWSVSRYACPFFSDYPEGVDWEDRIPLAWAIQVDVAGSGRLGTHWGPYGSYARDETALGAWDEERGDENIAVVAVPDAGVLASVADGVAGVAALNTFAPWDAVRLDLGALDLPAELDRVDAVLAECAERGLHTYWGTAKS